MTRRTLSNIALALGVTVLLVTIGACAMESRQGGPAGTNSFAGQDRERTPMLGDIPLLHDLTPSTGSGSVAFDPVESERNLRETRPALAGQSAPGSGAAGGRSPSTERARAATAWATAGPLPPNEELWVIATTHDDAPEPERYSFNGVEFGREDIGAGALVVTRPGATEFVPAPLQHTDVHADIAGFIASVGVEQTYANPFDVKIEATYVFPLPQNSAVSEFVMTVGERRIRAVVREREEAERIYEEARRAGHTASLMTQERPNIFTQKVANIEPGEAIDIDITYFHTLAQRDGWYEFVFPMTVGPRYNPAGVSHGVGAVGRSDERTSGQPTEVVYLSPDERTGHDVSLEVSIDAGAPLDTITCATHACAMDLDRLSEGVATVRLASESTIPNRDFVLRYRVNNDTTRPALVTHRDEESGYFALTLHPPRAELLEELAGEVPVEIIFVVDTSGSMRGEPLGQAKQAIEHTLRRLGPDDAFQIIRFANDASPLGDRVVRATDRNVREALHKLRSLRAKGGTEMLAGVRTALSFPSDRERTRFVCFLTDGFIGNEGQVLSAVDDYLGDARLFSFAIGSSPNRFLMERLAVMGRGAVAFLGPDESGAPVMDAFLDRVRTPALADIAIDFGDLPVNGLSPVRVPDLYAGRPVTIMGRFDPRFDGSETIRVTGRTGRGEVTLDVHLTSDNAEHPALADLWARAFIAEEINYALRTPGVDPTESIKNLALSHALLSPFTAFIAVDTARVTEGEYGVSVTQPVRVPDGVRYETTVRDDR